MMNVLVNGIGVLFMVGIVWWFWLSRPRPKLTPTQNVIEIRVKEGVYAPAYLQVGINQPLTLRFIREDASPCAAVVVFTTLNISHVLPLQTPIDLHLTFQKAGDYEFTCQMGMYRGNISVK